MKKIIKGSTAILISIFIYHCCFLSEAGAQPGTQQQTLQQTLRPQAQQIRNNPFGGNQEPSGTRVTCGTNQYELICNTVGDNTALTIYGSSGDDLIWFDETNADSDPYWCGHGPFLPEYPGAIGISIEHYCPSTSKVYIYTYAGNDRIYTGIHRSITQPSIFNPPAEINAGNGHDRIMGTEGNDIIWGGYGNDNISGYGGDDDIYGGPGNDIIDGGYGRDTIYGDLGDDHITADPPIETAEDAAENGIFDIGAEGQPDYDDLVDAGDGNDRICGIYGLDYILGGNGDDQIQANGGIQIYGGAGMDRISVQINSLFLDEIRDGFNGQIYGNGGNDRFSFNRDLTDIFSNDYQSGDHIYLHDQVGLFDGLSAGNCGTATYCRASYYSVQGCATPTF